MRYTKTISAILVSGLILSSCSSNGKKEAPAVNAISNAAKKAAIPVKVMTLAKTKIARTIDYTATILPFEEVNMAPSIPGRIEKIYVEIGDRVNKEDNLFLMDRTQLYQQKVQLASLAKDLSRLDTLLKSGSAKQQQYDQLKTQYDVTRTNVEFMEANTLLKAPFNGVVTGKYFEDGEMYSGTPTTTTGRSAVVTVMQVNPLKVNVSITEQYFPLIKRGLKAGITSDIYKGENFTGTVYRVAPTINSATRSFITELEVPNKNDLLRPGMFVRVSMDLGEVETFVVPASSVLVQEGTNIRYVFVYENGLAKRIEVLIGKRFDDQLEIISETLKDGVTLVTDGQSKLINNDRIGIEN
ncbi:MAG: efflux RND transporter periplasmic adaptor subunit [Bacteroidales bacterium]|jgi:RND family efflux transporter MFP subunit|nr:efflux RND transporter periplasmic adaptor subunit [Bacteroidales bacterium]